MIQINGSGPTAYASLPTMPQLHAMPQGIPQGPWGPLYRAAPGAQIPATYLPGMMSLKGAGVQLLGLGASDTTTKVVKYGLMAVLSAGLGAAIAYGAAQKKRPVLKTAAFAGAFGLGAGLFQSFVDAQLAKTAAAAE